MLKCLSSPNTGAAPVRCVARKAGDSEFQVVFSITYMSLSHPHSSPLGPHANGSPHQLTPFIHEEKWDLGLLLLLLFFLEHSKNERLYLGEL